MNSPPKNTSSILANTPPPLTKSNGPSLNVTCCCSTYHICLSLFTVQYLSIAIHGGWTAWELWSRCSRTCGLGQRYRKRHCTSPRPQNGGRLCKGASLGVRPCNEGSCIGRELSLFISKWLLLYFSWKPGSPNWNWNWNFLSYLQFKLAATLPYQIAE